MIIFPTQGSRQRKKASLSQVENFYFNSERVGGMRIQSTDEIQSLIYFFFRELSIRIHIKMMTGLKNKIEGWGRQLKDWSKYFAEWNPAQHGSQAMNHGVTTRCHKTKTKHREKPFVDPKSGPKACPVIAF